MIQKFKRKVLRVGQGKSKVTVDEHFQNLKEEHGPYTKKIASMSTLLDNYVKHARGMFSVAEEIVTMCSVDNQDSEFWGTVSGTHNIISTETVQNLQRSIDNSMLSKVTELRERFREIKNMLAEREESRSQMDYYRHKEQLLVSHHEKQIAEGKEEPEKQKKRRERTKQNLELKIADYERINTDSVNSLEDVHSQKDEWMQQMIRRFVKIEQDFATSINTTLSPIDVSRLSVHDIIYKPRNSESEPSMSGGLMSSPSSSSKRDLPQPTKGYFAKPSMSTTSNSGEIPLKKPKAPPPTHRPSGQVSTATASPGAFNSRSDQSTKLASSMQKSAPGARGAPPGSRPAGLRAPPPSGSRPPALAPMTLGNNNASSFAPPSPKMDVGGEKKVGLKEWTQHCTAGYKGVNIKNMASSWKDGLAFAALISCFRPDLIDYDSLPKDPLERLQIAFTAAEKAGVAMLLDADDVVDYADQKCIKTQLAMYQKSLANTPMKGKRG